MAITNQEYEVFGAFCLEKGIDTDGQVGEKNGALFGNYLNSQNQRITQANLQAAFDKIKGQLVFVNPTQAEYNRLATYFTEPERDGIAAFLNQQGLNVSDGLLVNWNIFARFMIDNKTTFVGKTYAGKALPVTPENLRYALASIRRTPQYQHLRWKTREPEGTKHYDAQAAVKAQKEAKKIERNEDEMVRTDGTRPLTGVLKAYRDANLRPRETAQPTKADDVEMEYKKKLENLIQYDISSNADRAEAKQKAQELFQTGIGYRVTFNEINRWWNQTKVRKSWSHQWRG